MKLVLMDAETGKEELVERDPEKSRRFRTARCFSEVSDELIATVYQYEKRRIYWKDKAFEADYKFLESEAAGQRDQLQPRTRAMSSSG